MGGRCFTFKVGIFCENRAIEQFNFPIKVEELLAKQEYLLLFLNTKNFDRIAFYIHPDNAESGLNLQYWATPIKTIFFESNMDFQVFVF